MRRILSLTFLAVFVMLAQGCATLPSPEQMAQETKDFQLPKLPEKGSALVYVARPSSLGGLIKFNVFLDDQQPASEMGYTRGGQHVYFLVSPGKHTVYSKAENWAELQISPKDGEIVFIEQDPSMGLIMARNNLILADAIKGRYFVMKTGKGEIIKMRK